VARETNANFRLDGLRHRNFLRAARDMQRGSVGGISGGGSSVRRARDFRAKWAAAYLASTRLRVSDVPGSSCFSLVAQNAHNEAYRGAISQQAIPLAAIY